MPSIPSFFNINMETMRIILLLVILFVVLTVSIGQSGFNKTFSFGAALSMYSIKYDLDNIYVYGVIFVDTNSRQKCFLVELDSLGNVLKWTEVADPNNETHLAGQPGSAIIKNDFGTVIPIDFIGQAKSGIAIINSDGNLEMFKEFDYGTDSGTSIHSIIECSDGGYIFTGWRQRPNYDVDAFVLKTNAHGERKWLKYYGVNGLREIGYSILELNNNEYVIGGVKDHKGYIFAIDSLGNKKWEWMNTDTTEVSVKWLHHMPNGDWVYRGYAYRPTTYNIETPYDVSVPLFIRRDSSMNLLVRKELVPYAWMNEAFTMIPSRDGGWITAGQTSTVTDNGPADSVLTLYGRVVKLDDDGDIVWEVKDTAFFSQYFSRSHLSGVAESPTGSIYAVGYCEHPTDGVWRSYGWLLKITADGCVDTLCTTTSILDQLERQSKKVVVYPNPTTDYLIFEIDEDIHEANAEIFDLHGRLLQRETLLGGIHALMFDTHLSQGIYAWRVILNDGSLLDNGKFVVK